MKNWFTGFPTRKLVRLQLEAGKLDDFITAQTVDEMSGEIGVPEQIKYFITSTGGFECYSEGSSQR